LSPLGDEPDAEISFVSTGPGNRSATVAAVGMRCSRVGCSGHAVASFCFDGRAALVWLDPLDPERGMGAGILCARHADTLTPPRGWHLQDRRTRAPRLWADRPAVAMVSAAAAKPSKNAAERPGRLPPEPLPFEEASALGSPRGLPAQRPGTEPADVSDLLDAQTPLLARAFAAAGWRPGLEASEGQ
jgi:hypothetical protein